MLIKLYSLIELHKFSGKMTRVALGRWHLQSRLLIYAPVAYEALLLRYVLIYLVVYAKLDRALAAIQGVSNAA